MKKLTFLSVFVVLVLALAACAPQAAPVAEAPAEPPAVEEEAPEPEPTPVPPMTIVDVAVADGRFTTLAAALQAADLVDALKGEGPFTVFAPTDDAFAKLPEGTVEALLADIPALTKILTYHVVPGEVLAADVVKLSSAMTLAEMPVKISVDGDKVMVNDAQVILTDVKADNGVIHVIDSVILPPEKDIVELAVEDGRFTTLAAALQAANLVDTLKGEGPFTVFAPTDDAFAKLPAGTVEALLADIPALTSILTYHVADGYAMASDVVALESVKTLNGKPVEIMLKDGMVYLNEAQVVITDILAKNGVIHVIDSVLLPPDNIVEAAVKDGRFTTLVAAVQAAELAETLQGDGPFTVFAPTDDAFAKLPAGTVEGLLQDIPALKNILLYHVVEGKVMAEDVVKLESADTVAGKPITIKVEGDKVMVNESQVIITDIKVSNGVIHVIDSVLLPPAE